MFRVAYDIAKERSLTIIVGAWYTNLGPLSRLGVSLNKCTR